MLSPARPPLAPLPWSLTAAGLLALAAFGDSRGAFGALPLFGMVLVAAHLAPERRGGPRQSVAADSRSVPPSQLAWMLRLALLLAAGLGGAGRPPIETTTILQAPAMDWLGHVAAAELLIPAWCGRRGAATGATQAFFAVLLFLVGTHTYTAGLSLWLTAPFLWCLGLALRGQAHPAAGPWPTAPPWRALVAGALALAAAFLLGGSLAGAIALNRVALNRWANDLELGEGARARTGLSTTPVLGRTFGMRGSWERTLRLRGADLPNHVRAHAFTSYRFGAWGPGPESRRREPLPDWLRSSLAGSRSIAVEPLSPNDGVLFTTLDTTALTVDPDEDLVWDLRTAGSVGKRGGTTGPYRLLLRDNRSETGGLQARALGRFPGSEPGPECLTVPRELDPRVSDLAHRIAPVGADALQRVEAVTTYLLRHHRYSLSTNPGSGDPVSGFLLMRRAAHCEYFASASALLLRCLGVPTRYVTGYYAHEEAGADTVVVRGRDAHAWAEAWSADTGWITVEATPASGLPSDLEGAPPWHIRVWEQSLDSLSRAIGWVRAHSWRALVSALALAVLLVGLREVRARGAKRRREAYRSADGELTPVASRFEALLRRCGYPCPPHLPWSEHVQALEDIPGSASALNLPRVREFVEAYSAARFGPDAPSSARQLQELLVIIESPPPNGVRHQ